MRTHTHTHTHIYHSHSRFSDRYNLSNYPFDFCYLFFSQSLCLLGIDLRD